MDLAGEGGDIDGRGALEDSRLRSMERWAFWAERESAVRERYYTEVSAMVKFF